MSKHFVKNPPYLAVAPDDCWFSTDPLAVQLLVKNIPLSHNIWEPTCGLGAMRDALREAGYNVTATDAVVRECINCTEYDFLNPPDYIRPPRDVDIVLCPPKNMIAPFVKSGLAHLSNNHLLCLLSGVNYMTTPECKNLFRISPPVRVLILTQRLRNTDDIVSLKKGETGFYTEAPFAWYIFTKNTNHSVELCLI